MSAVPEIVGDCFEDIRDSPDPPQEDDAQYQQIQAALDEVNEVPVQDCLENTSEVFSAVKLARDSLQLAADLRAAQVWDEKEGSDDA